MFKPVDAKADFPAMERALLAWWKREGIVEKYLKRNEASDRRWSFIDGPITANNPMGVHHAWGRTYKDLYQRYKTMQGYRQRYQNGFDGQGLWIEVEVEKELGFTSKRDIESFGIGRFVDLCKERVRRFSAVQTEQSIRLGYWMDWDNSYYTTSDENNYAIWHFLKVCFERGWLYKGTDVMPWCPRCGTGLSEHEIVTEGYREVVHPGLYVRFPLVDREGESLLVWTTTPWTLTSNVAVAVHPEMAYVKVRKGNETLYLARGRLSALGGDCEVLAEMPGRELAGLRYRGPFDELPPQRDVEHRVIEWDEVSESEGTGIVHVAPGCGKEDFALGKEHGLAVIAPLDEAGRFVEGFDWLSGMEVYAVNEPIYDNLRGKGVLYRVDKYPHRYPFCWRCGSELVFRLVDEWFISMGELRHNIARVAERIRWVPEFGLQRELDWLRNMDDWMISKKRYWGLALPIYGCGGCGRVEVIGSKGELKERAVEGWEQFEGHSPHRPWVDAVKIACVDCGETVSRITDVGNPWLDAGIVPFSTLGYVHDSPHWAEWFPADLISESFPGQFRNWFYSLLTMATVLEDSEPCRAIFSYASMRDERGEEMHKSKGNAIWFDEAAEKMGVDAMRWTYVRHDPAANLNFGYASADDVRRRFLLPLWNVYSFFVTYANIDQFDPFGAPAPDVADRPDLDRWIVSELNALVAEVRDALEAFQPDRAVRAFESFVDCLSNWYVRRSRRRFWKAGLLSGAGEADADKLAAHATLHGCLLTLARLLAPFVPFVAEEMYQNLARSAGGGRESVHLDDYPEADVSLIDARLTEATRLAMRLSSVGRAARSKAGIKVRQPLATALVGVRTPAEAALLADVAAQVQSELNVHTVSFFSDSNEVTEYHVDVNRALLGPRYGRRLNEIAAALKRQNPAHVARQVAAGNSIEVQWIPAPPSGAPPFLFLRPEVVELQPDEIIVRSQDKPDLSVASEGGYTVAVTTEVTPELALEGLARELVHRIQNMRRAAGFDIADRIVTYYQGPPEIAEVMTRQGEYVAQETLSRRLERGDAPEGAFVETHTIDGMHVTLAARRE